MSVFGVGPAGENQVKFAGIFGDKDHAAGHNGVGAVMAAKKLKAFCASRGRGAIPVKSPVELGVKAKEIWEILKSYPGTKQTFDWGTGGPYEAADVRERQGIWPVKNYTTNLYPEGRVMTNQYGRERWSAKHAPCWACLQHHCHMITFTDGPYVGQTVEEPEYELYAAWGPLIGNTDPAECLWLSNLCTRLGLEGNEAGFLVSMVMELYEKETLSSRDTEGLELRWGNAQAVATLLERIAHREGKFANMLAEGTARAAEALGPEAMACGIYAKKGHSPRGHDHRSMWREMFDTATSDIATYEAGYIGPPDTEVASLKDGFSPEEVSTFTARSKGRRQFEDTLGTCTFCTRVPLQHVVDMVNYATGWDMTGKEAQEVGYRAANVMRAFNLRHGITPASEYPSQRWSSAPVDGPAKGVTINHHWDGMLDNYYRQMGWDRKSGRPLPETLRSLGLDQVAKYLWGR
jgi:aldehyde:ferredoxin oxidoreductase